MLNWRAFAQFFFGVQSIAWAVGFAKYLGATTWTTKTIGGTSYGFGVTPFPTWPNILDVLGLCTVGVFLLWECAQTLKGGRPEG